MHVKCTWVALRVHVPGLRGVAHLSCHAPVSGELVSWWLGCRGPSLHPACSPGSKMLACQQHQEQQQEQGLIRGRIGQDGKEAAMSF